MFVAPGGTDSSGNKLGLDVWSMNFDGTGITNLTASPGDDTDPAWSPDGARIGFASTRSNNLRQVFVAEIACTPAPGACSLGKPRNYSYSPEFNAVEFSPVWSPDAARLAVAASINGAPGRIYFHLGALPEGGIAPTPSAFDRSDKIVGADHLDWSSDGLWLIVHLEAAWVERDLYRPRRRPEALAEADQHGRQQGTVLLARRQLHRLHLHPRPES